MENRESQRLERIKPRLARHGQDHLLQYYDQLSTAERQLLLDDIDSIPWDVIAPLIESHVKQVPARSLTKELAPPRAVDGTNDGEFEDAREIGRKLLREGKVAAFTVAGGQGTRLGFDGPKGAFPCTPIGDRSLFELFAMMVRSAGRKYGVVPPWYLMTSRENHRETVSFFEQHGHFGLDPDQVRFFSQGMLPAMSPKGRILLAQKHRVALAPDGHGGSLKALQASGSLQDMRSRGIEILSYFQVDNPLVRPFDSVFLGMHRSTGSEMSTKVTGKAGDDERVGNVCLADGRLTVIEYSEFPADLCGKRTPDGRRLFDCGNLAIHLLELSFVERITKGRFELPYRRADKAVAFVDEHGELHRPARPNAVKLESFVFDALPLAERPLVMTVDRADEFAPIKNADGPDSVGTSKRAQVERACRWLARAGVSIPRDGKGRAAAVVSMLPTFALDPEDVASRLDAVPLIEAGSEHELS